MTGNELFELGIKYYTGDGVPKDRTAAARYFEMAAEQGHVSAPYNLGVMYKTGDGVEVSFERSRDWFEKAAALGSEKALKQLVQLNFLLVDSYLGFGSSGFESARDTAKQILSYLDKLGDLDETGKFYRREANRILGMISAAEGWQHQPSLERAKSYYDEGLPISEGKNVDAIVTYTIVLDNLADITGEATYRAMAYDAALEIYEKVYDRITDKDHKQMILSFLVMEKLYGRFHPVDLNAAEKLNNEMLALSGDYYDEYSRFKRAIDEKRRAQYPYSSVTSSTSASSTYQSSSSFGDKVKGVFGKLFR